MADRPDFGLPTDIKTILGFLVENRPMSIMEYDKGRLQNPLFIFSSNFSLSQKGQLSTVKESIFLIQLMHVYIITWQLTFLSIIFEVFASLVDKVPGIQTRGHSQNGVRHKYPCTSPYTACGSYTG